MYIIGDVSRSNQDAFDALEGAFGAQEFTTSEAIAVLQGALDISELEASRLARRLATSGAIKEV